MDIQVVQNKIFDIRGYKVILDFDLAEMYETETKILKQSVRRNISRFPSDFMFELSENEWEFLRSQIVTSNRGGTRYKPFAFTQEGVAMLSSVLRTDKAININISIMRAFVMMRQFAADYSDLLDRINDLERTTNAQFGELYDALTQIVSKDQSKEVERENRPKIGFKTDNN